MKKTNFEHLDLTLYEETLDNGLRVFIVPKNNISGIYATFSTKYGSNTNEFVPIGEEEMIKVPDGVAHFLEHKVFEQKDGVDPFTYFGERGMDANANTNYKKTTYLISGIDNFKESLEFLLDYVQEPYFTDENVQKEKGIIEQELKMYQDSPYRVLYDGIMYNTFVEDPSKISIGGTVESIYKITKEDLYKCYNTFYHPSNMFVCITGNVNPDEVIDVIKQNQNKKKFQDKFEIKKKKYNEPDYVSKDNEVKRMNVVIPKTAICYKINVDTLLKKIQQYELGYYINLFFDIKLGSTSDFNYDLKSKGIITTDLDIDIMRTNNHIVVLVSADTKNPDLLLEKIDEVLNDKNVLEKEFIRKKKPLISSCIYMSDNIYSINNKIMNNIIVYDKVITNDYDIIKNLDYKIFKNIVKKLDLKNKTKYTIMPKD